MEMTSRSAARTRAGTVLALCVLLAAVAALFATAPIHDDFWWTDAPGHAMNGALIHDYVAAFRFISPLSFATNYYLHYPALTITLYPPLFPLAEAVMFFVLGVTHFAAQLTVSLFALLLAYSLYASFRTASAPTAAAGAALLVLATPVVALWSRQVMLEVPALALLTAAAAIFLRFLEDEAPWRLYLSVLLLCAAVYTKQTAAFAAAPFAATLLIERGRPALRRRSTWFAAILGLLLVAPLAVFTIVFASHDIAAAAGIGSEAGSNFALASFLWYARALPAITGWAPIAAAAGYLALVGWRGWASAPERRLGVLMIAWFAADYLFISPIAHREPRYGVFLAVPVAALAMALLLRVLPRGFASAAALTLGAVAFAATMALDPAPRVAGYDAVAAFVLDHADKNSVVLFQGYRSPNLVFALRAQSSSPSIYLLRSEKLLVNYKVTRFWGVKDRGLSQADLEKLVDRYGIVYVVLQPDFWTDLPSMAALQKFIYSDRFSKIAEFPIQGNVPTSEHEILIFKNNRPTHPAHPEIEQNMPLLGGNISGKY